MTHHFLLRFLLGSLLVVSSVHCGSEEPSTEKSDASVGAGDDDDDEPADDDPDSPPTGRTDASRPRVDSGRGTNDAGSDTPARNDAGGTKNDGGGTKNDGGEGVERPDDLKPVNGFVNLAIKPGAALDRAKGDTHPSSGFTAPAGWNWYNIEGAKCRDGSQNGMFVRFVEGSKKLFIYFEGGGACSNPGFCRLNPININQQFLTGGESALASLIILPVPQAPNGAGVFDTANANNPFKDWNQVYIPYCSGDVHFGSQPDGTVPGVSGKQMFLGAENTKRMVARLAGTFTDLERFVVGGSSAGAFGAGLNYGMVQDTFGPKVPGMALLDAGPPFRNMYIPVCLQKIWRETWNLDANLPSDCGELCKSPEGGNLMSIVDYWRKKYKDARVALVSGIHDEIIRLFFALGDNDCKDIMADPEALFIGTIGQTYDPEKFKQGLLDLRMAHGDSGQFASYYMDGFPNATAHQCLFRPRFYEEAAGPGTPTIAAWVTKFLAGEMTHVGP